MQEQFLPGADTQAFRRLVPGQTETLSRQKYQQSMESIDPALFMPANESVREKAINDLLLSYEVLESSGVYGIVEKINTDILSSKATLARTGCVRIGKRRIHENQEQLLSATLATISLFWQGRNTDQQGRHGNFRFSVGINDASKMACFLTGQYDMDAYPGDAIVYQTLANRDDTTSLLIQKQRKDTSPSVVVIHNNTLFPSGYPAIYNWIEKEASEGFGQMFDTRQIPAIQP